MNTATMINHLQLLLGRSSYNWTRAAGLLSDARLIQFFILLTPRVDMLGSLTVLHEVKKLQLLLLHDSTL